MISQILFGKPKKCINRKCKARFFQESITGYLPHTNCTVLCVVRCPVCKDQFAIIQAVSIIREYADELPKKPQVKTPNTVITIAEVNEVKKKLKQENILSSLNDEDGKHF